jgi:hypothetical protein
MGERFNQIGVSDRGGLYLVGEVPQGIDVHVFGSLSR